MSKARNAAASSMGDVMSGALAFYDAAKNCLLPIYDGQIFGRQTIDEQFKNDKLMSREHCRIRLIRNGVFIEDLGSSNATRVNQKPIPAGVPVMVNRGDVIEMGNQRFVVMAAEVQNAGFTLRSISGVKRE